MNRVSRGAALLSVALLVGSCAAACASAQAVVRPSQDVSHIATAAPPLAPLSFLAGSCWKGTFPGRSVTDEHCFKWMYDGRFLRDHHQVVGDSVPYEGESTYAWDDANKQIVFYYIALPGFYSYGNVEARGDTLLFHDNLQTSESRQMRTTWRRLGSDSYVVRVEEITGGVSRVWWTMEMKRSRAQPPSNH